MIEEITRDRTGNCEQFDDLKKYSIVGLCRNCSVIARSDSFVSAPGAAIVNKVAKNTRGALQYN